MTEFEQRISFIGSDRSTNCATTTAMDCIFVVTAFTTYLQKTSPSSIQCWDLNSQLLNH